jgi:alpha-1,2-mannosyltransferase
MTTLHLTVWRTIRDGSWLTRERVVGYLAILAVANVVGLGLGICRAHGWVIPAEPHFSTEFMSFYAAGRLVDAGRAMLVYAPGIPVHAFIDSLNVPPAHRAMEQALSHDPQAMYFAFFYPPVYWLLCAPLAHLPYYAACLLWVAGTGLALALCVHPLIGGWRRLWPAIAYLAVVENAGVGENAFLSAALVGFGLLQVERRPVLAGACFGALCYKPHFMLPVLLFLLVGWHVRALVSSVLSAALLCLLAAVMFGWGSWITYFSVIVPHAEYMFSHAGISYALQVTPGSAVRLLGGGGGAAALAQGVAMLFGAYCIWATRGASLDVRSAMVTASFPMLLSVMLGYDLTVCGLAILFLMREAARTGYLPWERTAMAAMFALPLVTEVFRTQLHIPLEPLVIVGFMALVLRRVRHGASCAMSSAPPRPA